MVVEILTTEGITVFMTSFLLNVVLETAVADGAVLTGAVEASEDKGFEK